jgi:hypothetical protein
MDTHCICCPGGNHRDKKPSVDVGAAIRNGATALDVVSQDCPTQGEYYRRQAGLLRSLILVTTEEVEALDALIESCLDHNLGEMRILHLRALHAKLKAMVNT